MEPLEAKPLHEFPLDSKIRGSNVLLFPSPAIDHQFALTLK
jgi:hypothetical protein